MRLRTCFGCLSLQTGTIIVGTSSMGWSILSGISAVPHVADIYQTVSVGNEPVAKLVINSVLAYLAILAIVAGLMIYGAQKRKPEFIFPWLALATTDLLVWCSFSLAFIALTTLIDPAWYLICLAILSAFGALHVYIWLLIYSFYIQLMAEKYGDALPPYESKSPSPELSVYHNI